MKTDSHKASPEIISALLARIETLEQQEANFLLTLLDMVQQKKVSLAHCGEWTDEELRTMSMESLKRAWGPEDSVYDNL